jgi:multimeric flavodoxin WrbA
MIHILGICGSPVSDGNTLAVLREALGSIQDEGKVRTELIPLAGKRIEGCKHCNWCIKKQTEDRFCVQEDGMKGIYPELLKSDGVLLATPVHFGRLSGLMANMIDRLRVFVHGNVHAGRLRNKIGGALAVSFFRGGGVETTLSSINAMFFIFDMIVATSRLYQLGAASFSSLDGKGAVTNGVSHMALEDSYGMTSAKLLARRILELAEIVRAGKGGLTRGRTRSSRAGDRVSVLTGPDGTVRVRH